MQSHVFLQKHGNSQKGFPERIARPSKEWQKVADKQIQLSAVQVLADPVLRRLQVCTLKAHGRPAHLVLMCSRMLVMLCSTSFREAWLICPSMPTNSL